MTDQSIDAFFRIMDKYLPKMINSGKVLSLTSSRALVLIGSEINSQPCSYDPSAGIGIGDMVILVKPPRVAEWSIVAVTFRKAQGKSNTSRETPNSISGAKAFAKASTNGGGSAVSVTGASQLVNSQTVTFNGGKAMIIYNGFATIASGSSLLNVNAGLDGAPGSNNFNGNIGTAATPVNFVWISPDQLYGQHSIEVYAGRSSANISLTNYQFQVIEI